MSFLNLRGWKALKGMGMKIHIFTTNNPEKEPRIIYVFDGDVLNLDNIKNAKITFSYNGETYSMTVEMEE